MVGKLGPGELAAVLDRTGAPSDAIATGPAYGEDAAAIEVPGGTLVVSADPISLAASRVGTLAVHVACNDVAASGGDPQWLTSTVFAPDRDRLDAVTAQLDEVAADLGVAIVGGHTELEPSRDRPLVVLTAIGTTDRFVPTGGAEPGDRLLLAGTAGMEGTAILATDFGEELGVESSLIERGTAFFDRIGVLPAARAVRDRATAMHDPTEGGVLGGCYELASAADVTVELDRDAVPVAEETAALCAAADVDPLRIFGSGSLLATVEAEELDPALDALAGAGIHAAAVGRVTERGDAPLAVDGAPVAEPIEDDLYELWE